MEEWYQLLDLLPDAFGRAFETFTKTGDSTAAAESLVIYLDELGQPLVSTLQGYVDSVKEQLGGDLWIKFQITTSPYGREPILEWVTSLEPLVPEGMEDYDGLVFAAGIKGVEDLVGVFAPIVGIVLAEEVLKFWKNFSGSVDLHSATFPSFPEELPDDPVSVIILISTIPALIATILDLATAIIDFVESHYNEFQPIGEALASIGEVALGAMVSSVLHSWRARTQGGGIQAVIEAVEDAAGYPEELETDEYVLRVVILAPEIEQ